MTTLYSSIFYNGPRPLRPFFGPTLYRYHGKINNSNIVPSWTYHPSSLESTTCTFFGYQNTVLGLSKYYLLYLLCSRNSTIDVASSSKLFLSFTILYASTWFTLGLLRSLNENYVKFIEDLCNPEKTDKLYKHYDYDLTHWPVDIDRAKIPVNYLPIDNELTGNVRSRLNNPIYAFLGSGLARWLVMPGSLGVINNQISPQLLTWRRRQIEVHGAQRNKIKINDHDSIDTVFVDRRSAIGDNDVGKILIICTEGNAGFYEVGLPNMLIQKGYSVVGWNRPGFGQSSGTPSPKVERDAIITLLTHFHKVEKFNSVYLYGWSIGGYATAVGSNLLDASTEKPMISGVILDATFDHITPMIPNVLPAFAIPLAEKIVKQEWDLDVSTELTNYDGPVIFYRRLKDEILATGGSTRPDTNRINWLVFDFVKRKFDLNTEECKKVWKYICTSETKRSAEQHGDSSEVIKFLRSNFIDINNGHNDQFPPALFILP